MAAIDPAFAMPAPPADQAVAGEPALLTPPVGMVLFVLAKVSRLGFERTVAATMPWLIPLLVTLAAITYVPQLVLWLPGIMYPK